MQWERHAVTALPTGSRVRAAAGWGYADTCAVPGEFLGLERPQSTRTCVDVMSPQQTHPLKRPGCSSCCNPPFQSFPTAHLLQRSMTHPSLLPAHTRQQHATPFAGRALQQEQKPSSSSTGCQRLGGGPLCRGRHRPSINTVHSGCVVQTTIKFKAQPCNFFAPRLHHTGPHVCLLSL